MKIRFRVVAGLLAVASFAMAQDQTQNAAQGSPQAATGGWHRVGDTPASSDSVGSQTDTQISQSSSANVPTAASSTYPDNPQSQPAYSQAPTGTQQQQYPAQQRPPMQMQGAYTPVPAQVPVAAGTYLTVRINQRLSSDHSQVGDAFSATLVRPLVANGVVLAEPGQTMGGRVAQVQKSGHISGLAKLGIELTDLTLVDGQQLPVKTMLVSRTAKSSNGRDAGAIAGTTALGAAAGAVADLGRGAAIGAGAGAVVGIVGVLVTRGQPGVIYPEQELTFRIEDPLTVSTERSPQAFRYVQPNEYSNQMSYNPGPAYQGPGYGSPSPGYGVAVPPYYGYPYYGYPYYPYSGFSVFVGPGFYGRGFYGRGFYGGRGYYGGGFRGGFRR